MERIERLCDDGTVRPLRGPHSPGVVAARGLVNGRAVVCYAQESRHAGGSVGTGEADTVVRTLRLARRTRAPLVGFLESAGARLQEGVAALGGFGRIFSHNVALSGRVPQISVITGTAAGGGCYSPALTDFIVMTRAAAMFLTGPQVVHEALGEHVGTAELGGARVHEGNGVCQLVAADDSDAARTVRRLLAFLPQHARAAAPRAPAAPTQSRDPGELVPREPRRVYDVRAVVGAIVDRGELLELSGRWGRNLVTGFARLDGIPVGVIANQPRFLGGVIDTVASQKGARFVRTCSAFGLPLLVFVDTPGFMPGARQESAGVIRHGAELLRAFVESSVPRFTVVLRKAYGGAYITMNSRDIGADLAVAWPGAEIGIMGPRSAAVVLHSRRLRAAEDHDGLVAELANEYAQTHLAIDRALELGLVDEVIAPARTRSILVRALSAG
jgi:acetyl-CoA carboxylase carboxyltransferase component